MPGSTVYNRRGQTVRFRLSDYEKAQERRAERQRENDAAAPKPCHSSRCDYDEPHKHGFACGPRCLCGEGMQAAVPLNSETGDKP